MKGIDFSEYNQYYTEIYDRNQKYVNHIEADKKRVEASGHDWIPWGTEMLEHASIEGYLNWKAQREIEKFKKDS